MADTVDTTGTVTQPINADSTSATQTHTVTPTVTVEEIYKSFKTKEDFDSHAKGAKLDGEKDILKIVGLKPEEKDMLKKYKEAYDASLSDGEKATAEFKKLQTDYQKISAEIGEKDVTIQVLCKISGKTVDEISKAVKMAKAITDDDTPLDKAIDEVMAMINPAKPDKQDDANKDGKDDKTANHSDLPKGVTLNQPDTNKPEPKEKDPTSLTEALMQKFKK